MAIEILFAGLPNVGKSSLIANLTGHELEVGNWTGTTVEKRSLAWHPDFCEQEISVIDLPGSYSLQATSPEEEVTREVVLTPSDTPRLLVNVLDAGHLERDLFLTLELRELGLPTVVVLNLVDEARAFGTEVDAEALSERLGCPVVETVATRSGGSDTLKTALKDIFPWQATTLPTPDSTDGLDSLEERLNEVLSLTGDVVTQLTNEATERHLRWQSRWDSALLHPLLGPILFLVAMLLVFRFTFLLSDPWITFLETVQGALAGLTMALPLPRLLSSFIAEGLIGGLGTVAAFAPVLFFLYLGMSFLERSGFLPRVAVVADRILRSVGLSGRSLIPLLLGFGCNVPALSACRTLDSPKEKLKAAIAIPFMSCSARLAVFTLFAAIFFPGREPWVVFGLYLGGLVLGLLSALLLTRGEKDDLAYTVLEIPPVRVPPAAALFRQAWLRTMDFVKGAGGLITVTVVVVWALLHIPNGFEGKVMDSLYGRSSQALVTVFEPMGVEDPHLVGALIPGFVAKEVVIGSLATSISGLEPIEPISLGQAASDTGNGMLQALKDTGAALIALVSGLNLDISPGEDATPELRANLAERSTAAGALAYMVFILLYTPCVATVAALRDLVGWRWAGIVVVYQIVSAWVFGVVVYQAARAMGFG